MSWLNDIIIQAVQNLLKKETDLYGLQTPLRGINFQFKSVNFRVVVINKLSDAVGRMTFI